MDFSTILTASTYFVSTLAFADGLRLMAQAPGPGGDWTGGPSALIVGVLGLIITKIAQDLMQLQRAKQERESAREARDSRVRELESNLETTTIMLAETKAELRVWKEHCSNQPPLAKIRAAQTRARKNPSEFVDDAFLDG